MSCSRSLFRTCLLLLAAWAVPAMAAAAPAGPVTWQDTVTVTEAGASWGRMTALGDGHWLMVYTVFPEHAPSRLEIVRSDDHARSWAVVTQVAESGRDLDNGELVRLDDGTLLLAMRSVVDGRSYRLPVYRSVDGGTHWSHLSDIDANENPGGRTDRGLWEPTFNVLGDGSLSVLYADETLADGSPSYNQVVSQRVSTDGGTTWGPVAHVVKETGGGDARPGMPVMTRMADGRYILAFEVCGAGPDCDVAYQISGDGRHWPDGLGTGIPDQRCGPSIVSTRDGLLLITSCQNEVSYSDDGGASWMTNDPAAWPIGFKHSWPAIYQTGPDEVAVVNGGDDGALKIRFGRLPPGVNGSSGTHHHAGSPR